MHPQNSDTPATDASARASAQATAAARHAAAGLSLLAWTAIAVQAAISLDAFAAQGRGVAAALVLMSGYFTILTNLFVALSAGAFALRPQAWLAGPAARGCATTAIVLVGLGYHLLLRAIWDPQGWQLLADNLLHYAVPAAALAHWLIFPPRRALPLLAPLRWAAYPVAYLAYALIRGAWLGTYPYPFIDVPALGYGRALANASGLLAAFVVAGFALRLRAGR